MDLRNTMKEAGFGHGDLKASALPMKRTRLSESNAVGQPDFNVRMAGINSAFRATSDADKKKQLAKKAKDVIEGEAVVWSEKPHSEFFIDSNPSNFPDSDKVKEFRGFLSDVYSTIDNMGVDYLSKSQTGAFECIDLPHDIDRAYNLYEAFATTGVPVDTEIANLIAFQETFHSELIARDVLGPQARGENYHNNQCLTSASFDTFEDISKNVSSDFGLGE